MITKTKSYQTSDGQIFGSVPEAQKHELCLILAEVPQLKHDGMETLAGGIADHLLASSDKVADILTTKGSSKPSARAVNGGKKTRKPKTDATPASAPVPATV